MCKRRRIQEIFDSIGMQEGDSVFIVGCDTGEAIDCCLVHNANMVVGLDNNPLNVECLKNRYSTTKNVEIAKWENLIYPRWIEKFDLIISMVDLCDLDNPRQFVKDVSMLTRESARFVIICKNEQSDSRVLELLYGHFMIISRAPINEDYIIKSIKLPRKRL